MRDLGRLDEAANKFVEAIELSEKLEDFRQVAACKQNQATVRLLQKRYADALAGYHEALSIFEKQNESREVASSWHQIGIVHQRMGETESAEAAYHRSLKINSQNNNQTGQAMSLTQLGNLSDDELNRPEEAFIFYRQAADVNVELGDLKSEGIDRNNIAETLRKLNRYDDARTEILRAIECARPFGHASQPWKSFSILQRIEEATGNSTAARAAWVQARDAYLAYRRQGGYASIGGNANLVEHVVGLISQQKFDKIEPPFNKLASDLNASDSRKVIIQAMIKILNGSRDKALGDDLALSYADAAEVLFLIERLGN